MTKFLRVLFFAVLAGELYILTSPERPVLLEAEVATSTPTAVGEVAGTSTTPIGISNPLPTKNNSSPTPYPVATPAPYPTANPQAAPTPAPSSPAPSSPVSSPAPSPAPTPTPTPLPVAPAAITAWMQGNDWAAAVTSANANAKHIGEVSPAWYVANADGTVSPRSDVPVDDATLIKNARTHGQKVVPLVMSVPGAGAGPEAIIKILQSPALRQKQIAALVKIAVEHKYDGLDIDYESIPPQHLQDLALFIEEFSTAMHKEHKLVAVSLETHPHVSVLPAWERIGRAADNVRLMAYGKQSAVPTHISDPVWARARLTHMLKVIPKEKVTLGLPLYCLRWNESGIAGSSTWARLHATTSKYVRCEDAASVKEKMQIGKELGVTHFAFWRIGGEDPGIWEML